MRVKFSIGIRALGLQYACWTKNTDLAISPSELFYKSRQLNWTNLLGGVASRSSCPQNCFKQTPKQCHNSFTSRRAQHYKYWRSKFGGNGLFPIQFAVTSLHHTPSWRNVWILVRNSPFYIDIHTPLWINPTLLSLLWYSALLRWRHNRRPRNYRFIQWGSKTDAKKKALPERISKNAFAGFLLSHQRLFLTTSLRIGRHGFLHRSAALIEMPSARGRT